MKKKQLPRHSQLFVVVVFIEQIIVIFQQQKKQAKYALNFAWIIITCARRIQTLFFPSLSLFLFTALKNRYFSLAHSLKVPTQCYWGYATRRWNDHHDHKIECIWICFNTQRISILFFSGTNSGLFALNSMPEKNYYYYCNQERCNKYTIRCIHYCIVADLSLLASERARSTYVV